MSSLACQGTCVPGTHAPVNTACPVICPQVADLSMGDLLLHCTVAWINPPASLVKSKKELHLAAFGKDYYSCFFSLPFLECLYKKGKRNTASFRDFKLLALPER